MTCSIAFNFYSFLMNIQSKQAEQIIHTVDTQIKCFKWVVVSNVSTLNCRDMFLLFYFSSSTRTN